MFCAFLRIMVLVLIAAPLTSGHALASCAETPAATPTAATEIRWESSAAVPSPPVIVGLARWTFDPGALIELEVPGPELYVIEAGTITFVESGGGGAASPPASGSDATPGPGRLLRAGDHVAAAAGSRHLLQNTGSDAAVVLNVVIFPASFAIPSWLPAGEMPPGVRMQDLAADVVDPPVAVPSEPVTIALARIDLPVGTESPLAEDVLYGLVVIERGAMTAGAEANEAPTYHAGETVRFDALAEPIIRSTGDDALRALVLTISAPSPSGGTPSGTPPC